MRARDKLARKGEPSGKRGEECERAKPPGLKGGLALWLMSNVGGFCGNQLCAVVLWR
jgi:hypothetical protein